MNPFFGITLIVSKTTHNLVDFLVTYSFKSMIEGDISSTFIDIYSIKLPNGNPGIFETPLSKIYKF
jgi:hypothetical protein